MSEQPYDFFGQIFQRYFRTAIDAYPRMGGALVERLLTLTDDVPDNWHRPDAPQRHGPKPRPRTPGSPRNSS